MPDVIPHHLTDKQPRQKDTHYRINQIQPVRPCAIKVLGKKLLDVFHQKLQHISSQGSKYSDEETQNQYKLLFSDMSFSPHDKTLEKRKLFLRNRFHNLQLTPL